MSLSVLICFQSTLLLFSWQSNAQIVDETIHRVFIDSVWVANQVSFDLHTIDDKQYVAYYNKDSMMTLASRELGRENWKKKV